MTWDKKNGNEKLLENEKEMQRRPVLLLFLDALALVDGARRGVSKPRRPVQRVDESQILPRRRLSAE